MPARDSGRRFAGGILQRALPAALLAASLACQNQSWEQYMNAGAFAYQDENYEEAEQWFLSAEQAALRFDPSDPRLAVTLGNLADLYHAQARDAEAESLYHEALSRLERIDGLDSPRVARFVADLAGFYAVLDRPEEAEPLFLRALATLDWELGPEHHDVLVVRTRLAGMYLESARYDVADPLYREVLAIMLATTGSDQDLLLTVLREYARLLRSTGRDEEAAEIEARAREIVDAL